MPRKSPFVIALTYEERGALSSLATKYTSPYRDVIQPNHPLRRRGTQQ